MTLFVANSIQLVQRIPYQGNPSRFWKLHSRRKIICTVKHADVLMLVAEEETVL